jgi:hypothetical protein
MPRSIVGPTRAVIEGGGTRATFERLKLHLTALSVGYLKEVSDCDRAGNVNLNVEPRPI